MSARQAWQDVVGLGEESPFHHSAPLKMAVLGHSYVSRLRDVYREPVETFDSPQGKRGFSVRLFGVSGGIISTIKSTEAWRGLIRYQPRITYVLLGGNDLQPSSKAPVIGQSLINLAQDIERETGGICKVLSIERRQRVRSHGGLFSEANFNSLSNYTNLWLARHARRHYISIKFSVRNLDSDEVHLKAAASARLWVKIRDLFVKNLERESCYVRLNIPDHLLPSTSSK